MKLVTISSFQSLLTTTKVVQIIYNKIHILNYSIINIIMNLKQKITSLIMYGLEGFEISESRDFDLESYLKHQFPGKEYEKYMSLYEDLDRCSHLRDLLLYSNPK